MHTLKNTPAYGRSDSFYLVCHVSDGRSSLIAVPVHILLVCHAFRQDLRIYNVRHATLAEG